MSVVDVGADADAGEKDDDEANGVVDADGDVVVGVGDDGLSRLMPNWRWRSRKWSRPFSS